MDTLTKIAPDYEILLKEPQPFEMELPWGEEGFAQRFYDIVHYWGIPTEKEISFIESYLPSHSRVLDLACGGGPAAGGDNRDRPAVVRLGGSARAGPGGARPDARSWRR